MSVIIDRYAAVDLMKPLTVQTLPDVLLTGDRLAHRFHVQLTQGGKPVAVSGSVSGVLMRADGVGVALTGSVERDGSASVTLNEACYTVPGWHQLVIRVVDAKSGVKTAVYAVNLLMSQGSAAQLVEAENLVPELDDLLAQIERMEQATTAAEAVVETLEGRLQPVENSVADMETRTAVVEKLRFRVDNLEAAAKGCLYRLHEDRSQGWKVVPEGAMPWASLDMIGAGDAVRLECTGKNLLVHNDTGDWKAASHNGMSVTVQPDGGLLCIGTPTAALYYNIIGSNKHPEYIGLLDGITIPSSQAMDYTPVTGTNSAGDVVTIGAGIRKNTTTGALFYTFRKDVTYNEVRYPQIEYGSEATAFEKPCVSVLELGALTGKYFPNGMHAVGDVQDEISFEAGTAVQRIGEDGSVLDEPVVRPLDQMDAAQHVAAVRGGVVKFVDDSGTLLQVSNQVTYMIGLGGAQA